MSELLIMIMKKWIFLLFSLTFVFVTINLTRVEAITNPTPDPECDRKEPGESLNDGICNLTCQYIECNPDGTSDYEVKVFREDFDYLDSDIWAFEGVGPLVESGNLVVHVLAWQTNYDTKIFTGEKFGKAIYEFKIKMTEKVQDVASFFFLYEGQETGCKPDSYPFCQEIDVEFFGYVPEGSNPRIDDRNSIVFASRNSTGHWSWHIVSAPSNLDDENWHLFRLEYRTDSIVLTVDDSVIGTITDIIPDKNMHIYFGAYGSTHENSYTMYVAYVEVFKLFNVCKLECGADSECDEIIPGCSGCNDTCRYCSGDVDGDGDVDYNDFIILAGAYGSSSGQPAYDVCADFDKDGDVDYDDFMVLAGNYGKSCLGSTGTFTGPPRITESMMKKLEKEKKPKAYFTLPYLLEVVIPFVSFVIIALIEIFVLGLIIRKLHEMYPKKKK